MNRLKRITGLILVVVMLLGTMPFTAYAADYSEKSTGSVYISTSNRTNTLYYKNPHGNFKLKIWVDAPLFVSNKYSVSMYDNAGRCVWSAHDQGSRTYDIGGNVTKIIITTNAYVGHTLKWQRNG